MEMMKITVFVYKITKTKIFKKMVAFFFPNVLVWEVLLLVTGSQHLQIFLPSAEKSTGETMCRIFYNLHSECLMLAYIFVNWPFSPNDLFY